MSHDFYHQEIYHLVGKRKYKQIIGKNNKDYSIFSLKLTVSFLRTKRVAWDPTHGITCI